MGEIIRPTFLLEDFNLKVPLIDQICERPEADGLDGYLLAIDHPYSGDNDAVPIALVPDRPTVDMLIIAKIAMLEVEAGLKGLTDDLFLFEPGEIWGSKIYQGWLNAKLVYRTAPE